MTLKKKQTKLNQKQRQNKDKTEMELTIDNFDPEKIVINKADKKATPTTPPSEYWNLEFKYHHEGKKIPIRLELPMMTISRGIREMEYASDAGGSAKKELSVAMRFKLTNPEKKPEMTDEDYQVICDQYEQERGKYEKTVNLIMAINMKIRALIGEFKNTTGKNYSGLKHFKAELEECSQMRTLLYFDKNTTDFKYHADAPPSLYPKLFDFTGVVINNKPSTYKSRFVVPTEKGEEEVEWKYLKNVDIQCYPLIKIGKCFLGNKISPKLHLENCVIIDIQESKTKGRQLETLDRVKQKPDMVNHVQSQLTKFRELQRELENLASQDPALLQSMGYDPSTLQNLPDPQENLGDESVSEKASFHNFINNAGTPRELRTPTRSENPPPNVTQPVYTKFAPPAAKARLNLAQLG